MWVAPYGTRFEYGPGDQVVIRKDLKLGQQCTLTCTDRWYNFVDSSKLRYAGQTAVVDHIEDFYYVLRIGDRIIGGGWTDGMFEGHRGCILFDHEHDKEV